MTSLACHVTFKKKVFSDGNIWSNMINCVVKRTKSKKIYVHTIVWMLHFKSLVSYGENGLGPGGAGGAYLHNVNALLHLQLQSSHIAHQAVHLTLLTSRLKPLITRDWRVGTYLKLVIKN